MDRSRWVDERRGERPRVRRCVRPGRADEQRLDARQTGRAVGHGADGDRRGRDDARVVTSEHDGDHRLREVARPEGDLLERARLVRRPERPGGLDDQFAGRERGREMRHEEVTGSDRARPRGPSTTTVPSSATRQSGSSAAPSACAIEPPTVPWFRVTTWPT